MIKCSSCGQFEFIGTLYCSECGSRLNQVIPVRPSAGRQSAPASPPSVDTESAGAELASGALIGLKVVSTGEVLSLIGRDSFTLGRAVKSQAVIPDIDLDHLGAAAHGISRLHAELGFAERGVYIKDLESANGTLVNGIRLEPQDPFFISHGDTIEMGSLRMQFISRFRE